jgi:hypothetical protein
MLDLFDILPALMSPGLLIPHGPLVQDLMHNRTLCIITYMGRGFDPTI